MNPNPTAPPTPASWVWRAPFALVIGLLLVVYLSIETILNVAAKLIGRR